MRADERLVLRAALCRGVDTACGQQDGFPIVFGKPADQHLFAANCSLGGVSPNKDESRRWRKAGEVAKPRLFGRKDG